MRFRKMNGAGNDFIIIDGIREPIETEKLSLYARTLCERHLSIGSDGLMAVLPVTAGVKADFRMLYFNSDGTLGEMCGNGARCICRYGHEAGYSGSKQTVETTSGIVTGIKIDKRNYKIRLNDPSVIDLKRSAEAFGKEYECSYVELGVPGLPHAVTELPERYVTAVTDLLDKTERMAESAPYTEAFRSRKASQEESVLIDELRELGRALRYSEKFQKGANINFYRIRGRNEVDIITFERGVEDFTYACGTGTGSLALVLTEKKLADGAGIKVRNRGGLLTADVTGEGLFLTGSTNVVAEGEVLDESLFS